MLPRTARETKHCAPAAIAGALPSLRGIRFACLLAFPALLLASGCIRRTDVGEGGRKVTQVTAAFWGSQKEVSLMNHIFSEFEKRNPGIRVKRMHIASDYNAKLQTMMAANRAPDVFYMLSQDCRDYMNKGALMDLKPMLDRSRVIRYSDFFPDTVRQFRIGDGLYALSYDWSPCVVFYNRTFFDEAGVPYPRQGWTWDDFLDAAKKLTVRDSAGRVVRYGTLQMPGWAWRQWIVQSGGRTFNDALDRCIIDSPENVKAMQFAYDLTAKHHVAPPANDSDIEPSIYFMSGRVAMVLSYRWFITHLDPLKRYEWGIGPTPRGPVRANYSGAVGFAMSSQCRKPRAAWKLIEYLCGPEGQAAFVESRWGVPTLRSLAAQVGRFEEPGKPHHNYSLFAEEVKHSVIPLSSPYIPEQQFSDICQKELDLMFLGRQTPRQALRQMAVKANRIIARNRK